MIPFIKPYLDKEEEQLLKLQQTTHEKTEKALQTIHSQLQGINHMITTSGEDAIQIAIQHAKKQHRWNNPIIAIPSVCCASVYRPAKKEGTVILMDAGNDWNCIYDDYARKADIVLFANLGGLRIELPEKQKDQIFIDDAAQCFDGFCGLRKEADYGIFSFGNGKQMFAKGGGILTSHHHALNENINSISPHKMTVSSGSTSFRIAK